MNTLGLELWMVEAKCSHKELADKIFVSYSTMQNWIRRRTEIPLWAALEISHISGRTIPELFERGE